MDSDQKDGQDTQPSIKDQECQRNGLDKSSAKLNLDTAILFKEEVAETLKQHYSQVRIECCELENAMKIKQAAVIKKKEASFQSLRNEIEINQLKNHQHMEVKYSKAYFETFMAAVTKHKEFKTLNREFSLQAKMRDLKILQQEGSSALISRMEFILQENRAEFTETVSHVEEIHAKKYKNLLDLQESHNRTIKAINDLEINHLHEDIRGVMAKRYHMKQNHQRALDKKAADHLKELQAREMKHVKELFDFKLVSTDNVFQVKQRHQEELQTLEVKHYKERMEHEDKLTELIDIFHLKQLQETHAKELKKLTEAHKLTLHTISNIHSQRLTSIQMTPSESLIQRVYLNHFRWGESILEGIVYDDKIDFDATLIPSETPETKASINHILQAKKDLKELKEKQFAARFELIQSHCTELAELQESQQQEIMDLRTVQEADIIELQTQQENELSEMKAVQDREITMEQSIHDAECEALMERRILSSVLDSVIDGIIIIDTSGIIRRLNTAVEIIFDYKSEEIVGKNVNILMPVELAKRHDEIIANYLRTGVKSVIGVGRKLLGKRKNGQLFNIHLAVTEVKQEGVHLFTGVIRDITNESIQEEMLAEQRRKEEQLQLQMLAAEKKRADEAEQSRKQQERYIDMICHEIRNPLNGIQNNNELLSDLIKDISEHLKNNGVRNNKVDQILEASASAIQAINHCARHQKTIADDVLNMSKLSMSLIRISNTTPIDPIALTNTIFDTFRVEATKKDLDLILLVKPTLKAVLHDHQLSSDPARLSQILINLIANAIKFTEKQKIRRITVEIDSFESVQGEDTYQMLQFAVSDTGIGMTEAEQTLLFQQFSQTSYKTFADYGGSGLGLYISKELIVLMGGSINVKSQKGVGTTFTFTIKVNKGRPTEVSGTTTQVNTPTWKNADSFRESTPEIISESLIKLDSNSKGKPILIVDDNAINRKVLKAHLDRAGFACEEVGDGKQALDRFVANPKKYALILMDLEMPVMDGLTASKRIREEEAKLMAAKKLEYQVPIMAVTGNARHDPDCNPEHFGMQGGN
ncbi:hypothetical protein BCR33DRAFT_784885 [Rhizoclosmatium globosum]|uniref:histidine kinase n=1 Tax=Rhizoclosmatium globosum TaxID=329046 RepID=A0A1Y2CEV4_9FUNG|nr:hypothetical protein BCR33DRAFT_784885 [Rhizoclosmatium globosum]|eukprot:ORY44825.1 hypothetical protein BCR33DRAFT_784885 [Rhizoclosmatium globosum]